MGAPPLRFLISGAVTRLTANSCDTSQNAPKNGKPFDLMAEI
jgi:hypothetical protein